MWRAFRKTLLLCQVRTQDGDILSYLPQTRRLRRTVGCLVTAVACGTILISCHMIGKRRERERELVSAAAEGDLTTVDLLLREGTSVNCWAWDGWTPLTVAAFRGETTTALFLLSRGADPELPDGSGHTPEYWAKHRLW